MSSQPDVGAWQKTSVSVHSQKQTSGFPISAGVDTRRQRLPPSS
jgi:hypothetical protein